MCIIWGVGIKVYHVILSLHRCVTVTYLNPLVTFLLISGVLFLLLSPVFCIPIEYSALQER